MYSPLDLPNWIYPTHIPNNNQYNIILPLIIGRYTRIHIATRIISYPSSLVEPILSSSLLSSAIIILSSPRSQTPSTRLSMAILSLCPVSLSYPTTRESPVLSLSSLSLSSPVLSSPLLYQIAWTTPKKRRENPKGKRSKAKQSLIEQSLKKKENTPLNAVFFRLCLSSSSSLLCFALFSCESQCREPINLGIQNRGKKQQSP